MVNLLRFPHLVAENGGGAFVLLFFLCLNVFAFPLLIAEKALGNKLEKIQVRNLILLKNPNFMAYFDRAIIFSWLVLRLATLAIVLSFFLFISATSLMYLSYFIFQASGVSSSVADMPTMPSMQMKFFSSFLWVGFVFCLALLSRKKARRFYVYGLLPFSYLVLLVLVLKIIMAVDDFGGFRLLFYPDFYSLKASSLRQVLGHSLAVFFIGFGFYDHLRPLEELRDPINFFIQLIIQALLIAVFIGVIAIPMVVQVREIPFGVSWLFEILPRWLSYSDFGLYYCALFFMSLVIVSSFVAIKLIEVFKRNFQFFVQDRLNFRWKVFLSLVFILSHSLMIPVFQNQFDGWTGQSLLLYWDNIIVNGLLPVSVLFMLWVLFRFTDQKDRLKVFEKQQMFFHNQAFFKFWQTGVLILAPSAILLSWLFGLLGGV